MTVRARRCLRACLPVVLLVLVACGQAAEPHPQSEAADWVADVRSTHLRTDAALGRGDLAAAAHELRGQLGRAVPPGIEPEHARVVLQDLSYRLASVELDRGARDGALAAAEAGLARGRRVDVFTANLLIARGHALEALERDTQAAASYYDALEINRLLLAEVLAMPDGGTPP